LHWTGWGDPARQIWDEWSRTCPEKFDEGDQDKTWKSFDRPYEDAKISLGSLFNIAKEHGWVGPAPAPTPKRRRHKHGA
jgi:hypothetical protein